jgi:hypothetical protein
VGTKEGAAESKIGYKRRLTHVPQPGSAKKKSTVASSVGVVKVGGAAGKKDEDFEMEKDEEEKEEEFFSELHSPQIGQLSHFSKRKLVRLWLRRKVYDEVQEQTWAFSRGLREMMPPGLFYPYTRSLLPLY